MSDTTQETTNGVPSSSQESDQPPADNNPEQRSKEQRRQPKCLLMIFLTIIVALAISYLLWQEYTMEIVILSVGLLTIFALVIVPKRQVVHLRHLTSEILFDKENEARKTTAQIIAGVFVLTGLYYTQGEMIDNRRQAEEGRRLTREGQITDRFTHAVAQLGDPKIEVRLGGIYALERIATDSDRDQDKIAIMQILAAFVRENASPDAVEKYVNAVLKERTRLLASKRETMTAILSHPIVAVREDILGALTVIGRLPYRDSLRTASLIDLSNVSLRGVRLNGLRFLNASFSNADLIQADLNQADLSQVCLNQADLSKAWLFNASLSKAVLLEADLREADLREADLREADLRKADLRKADLRGADLTEADLRGAKLDSANFRGAILIGTKLKYAKLRKTQLQGTNMERVDFTGVDVEVNDLMKARSLYKCTVPKELEDSIRSEGYGYLIDSAFTHENQ